MGENKTILHRRAMGPTVQIALYTRVGYTALTYALYRPVVFETSRVSLMSAAADFRTIVLGRVGRDCRRGGINGRTLVKRVIIVARFFFNAICRSDNGRRAVHQRPRRHKKNSRPVVENPTVFFTRPVHISKTIICRRSAIHGRRYALSLLGFPPFGIGRPLEGGKNTSPRVDVIADRRSLFYCEAPGDPGKQLVQVVTTKRHVLSKRRI